MGINPSGRMRKRGGEKEDERLGTTQRTIKTRIDKHSFLTLHLFVEYRSTTIGTSVFAIVTFGEISTLNPRRPEYEPTPSRFVVGLTVAARGGSLLLKFLFSLGVS